MFLLNFPDSLLRIAQVIGFQKEFRSKLCIIDVYRERYAHRLTICSVGFGMIRISVTINYIYESEQCHINIQNGSAIDLSRAPKIRCLHIIYVE